jgi:hypothetical protein
MAKQPRSPFAASMGLYSGNIRSRISQAYQEANIQLQQMMATEQQRRETLLAMYKADMKAIGELKKKTKTLKKSIKSSGRYNSMQQARLLSVVATASSAKSKAVLDYEKTLTSEESKIRDEYTTPEKTVRAINKYLTTLRFNDTDLDSQTKSVWQASLKGSLGGGNATRKQKANLSTLNDSFKGLTSIQKQTALYDLLEGIEKKLLDDDITQFGSMGATQRDIQKTLNRSLVDSNLSNIRKHKKGPNTGLGVFLDHEERDHFFNKKWEKKKNALKKADTSLNSSEWAIVNAKEEYKKLSSQDPEVKQTTQEIEDIQAEILSKEKPIERLRKQLEAPMPELPGVRQLAGQILRRENQPFEEIAIERLKKPDSKEQLIADAEQMPDDFIEFMRLSNKGRKTMGVDLQNPKTKAERFYSTLKQDQNFPKTWPEQYKLIQENKELSGMFQKGLREDIKAIAVGQILKAYEDSQAIRQIPVEAAEGKGS